MGQKVTRQRQQVQGEGSGRLSFVAVDEDDETDTSVYSSSGSGSSISFGSDARIQVSSREQLESVHRKPRIWGGLLFFAVRRSHNTLLRTRTIRTAGATRLYTGPFSRTRRHTCGA